MHAGTMTVTAKICSQSKCPSTWKRFNNVFIIIQYYAALKRVRAERHTWRDFHHPLLNEKRCWGYTQSQWHTKKSHLYKCMYIKEFKRDVYMSRLVRGSQYTSHFRKLQKKTTPCNIWVYISVWLKDKDRYIRLLTREERVKWYGGIWLVLSLCIFISSSIAHLWCSFNGNIL